MSLDNPRDIESQFLVECEDIVRYVTMTRRFATIDQRKIREINTAFKGLDLPPLYRRQFDVPEVFRPDDQRMILAGIDSALPVIRAAQEPLLERYSRFTSVADIPDGYTGFFTECVSYFVERGEIIIDWSEDEIAHAISEIIGQLERLGECNLIDTEEGRDDCLFTAQEGFKEAYQTTVLDSLEGLHILADECEDIRFMFQYHAPDASVNVLRQGFLLLLMAFDAAVFDITRAAIVKKPAKLVPAIIGKKNKNFGASEVAKWIESPNPAETLTDEIMREKRLQGLIRDLQDIVNPLMDKSVGADFDRLMEAIRRRNLHVHKRGYADADYVSEFNHEKLKIGDFAPIGEQYLHDAHAQCVFCVKRLAAWAANI